MGMFDTLYFLTNQAPRCPEGHPITGLQTKSLSCSMYSYYVLDKILYKLEDHKESETSFTGYSGHSLGGEILELFKTSIAKPCMLTEYIYAYYSCKKCEPIYMYNDSAWGGSIEEKTAFHEFKLSFKDGILTEVIPQNELTREKHREQLLHQGCLVLDDDNPIVVSHKMRAAGQLHMTRVSRNKSNE